MLGAAAVRALVEDSYDARRRGDKDAMGASFAPGATLRIAGHAGLAGLLPIKPTDAQAAVSAMIDRLKLHESEILNFQTDGRVAMVQRRIDVTWFGQRFQTEVCDIWEFDDDGLATALTQYVDTALLAKMAEAAPEARMERMENIVRV